MIVVLLISAGPVVVLAGPRASLWIVVAVCLGWLSGGILLGAVRRLATPTVGGLSQPGKTRRTYVVPAQLPPPSGFLVGRDAEIDQMCDVLDRAGNGPPPVLVLVGEPGVGKSALAISLAHLVADEYPDGQLLVRFDTQRGWTAQEALTSFVEALKEPREPTPELSEQARWYRERVARRRVLVILDNVRHLSQVTPLLPSGPRCAAILTARTPIEGLSGHRSIPLAPLDPDASRQLFAALVGERRAAAEPACTARIVAASGGYPIALQMAGAAIAGRKNWTLSVATQRMDEVALPTGGVRSPSPFASILNLAFALLTSQERTGLVLLGLLDARIVAPWMLAALFRGAQPEAAPVTESDAGRILDRLAHARLTERKVDDGSGVLLFRVPAYVQAYARARMFCDLRRQQLEAAKREYVEEQQHRGERTPDSLLRRTVYQLFDDGRLSEALDAAREALALSQELGSAVRGDTAEAAQVAAEEGLTLAALAEVNAELGWIDEGTTCAESALASDKVSPLSAPRARRVLGVLKRHHHQKADALRHLLKAEEAVRAIDDPAERIRVLRELAVAQAQCDQPGRAAETIQEARRLCTAADTEWAARRLPSVLWAHGRVLLDAGELEQADQVLREADKLSGDPSARQGLWRPWIRYERCIVALRAGRCEQSRELGLLALEGFTTLRHRYGSAHCRLAIGRAYLAEGRLDSAASTLEEALGTLRRCGDWWLEATAATALARAYCAQAGQNPERARAAVALLSTAEQIFLKLGDLNSHLQVSRLLSAVESSLPSHPSRQRDGRLALAGPVHTPALTTI